MTKRLCLLSLLFLYPFLLSHNNKITMLRVSRAGQQRSHLCLCMCARAQNTGFYVSSSRSGFSGFHRKLETHNHVKFPLPASTFSHFFLPILFVPVLMYFCRSALPLDLHSRGKKKKRHLNLRWKTGSQG